MDDHNYTEAMEKELFSRLKVEYPREKEEVWKTIEQQISEEAPRGRIVRMGPLKMVRLGIAAAVALLIGCTLFARMYTVSHSVGAGELATVSLPDGSTVHLNAATNLSYAPYWWKIQRRVRLNGEAYFEVEKGSRFAVLSSQGKTEVVGTSFNIYARDLDYKVLCVTGKVMVSDRKGRSIFLVPGQYAALEGGKTIREMEGVSQEAVLAWRLNKFIYNTTSLHKVFGDVERHYNVRIQLSDDRIGEFNYTGLFERNVSAEEALRIICYSFDLELKKSGDNVFQVSRN